MSQDQKGKASGVREVTGLGTEQVLCEQCCYSLEILSSFPSKFFFVLASDMYSFQNIPSPVPSPAVLKTTPPPPPARQAGRWYCPNLGEVEGRERGGELPKVGCELVMGAGFMVKIFQQLPNFTQSKS